MLKKIGALLLIIQFPLFSFGINYIGYAKLISKAEMHVLEENYKTAFQYYDSAFLLYEKCFPNDAFVAAEAAAVDEDFKRVVFYFLKGAKWGLNLNCLNYPAFNEFNKSSYADTVHLNFTKSHALYLGRINKEYRKECIDLQIRDIKSNNTHFFLYKLFPFLGKKADQKLSDSSSVFLNELKKLIEKYGEFPSISNVGVRDSVGNSENKVYLEGRFYSILSPIMWHYPYFFQEFDSIIYKELVEGNYSAWHYALARDFSAKYYEVDPLVDKNKLIYSTYKYHVYWLNVNKKYSDEESELIDFEREKIGLYPVKYEQMKKIRDQRYIEFLKKSSTVQCDKKYLIYFNYYYL